MIALVVITDGRLAYLAETIASADARLTASWGARILVDDSGDPAHATELARRWPDYTLVSAPQRRGFAATVRTAWTEALGLGATHVFHLEEDFTLNRSIHVAVLAQVLDEHPEFAQIALKRQPVNAVERAAGGLMQSQPRDTWRERNGLVEHELNFTTNPSLIPAHAIRCALSQPEPLTEPAITQHLLAAGYRFAYLGLVDDPPLVTHIGEQRTQGWLQ